VDPTVLRNWSIEGLAGARYNSVSGKLDFQASGGFTRANVKQTKDWVDPFIGLRISAELANSFSASLRGDIGGFGAGSDFTWNAAALLGYHFDLFGQKAEAGLGYRALDWNFSSGSGSDKFKWNTTLHGPVLGLLVRF
jgi:hypothetical protein